VGEILLKIRVPRNYSGQWEYVGQVLLKIRKPRKHSWPVGICGTDTFKNRNNKKIFFANRNM
jgi:hypothetical protein